MAFQCHFRFDQEFVSPFASTDGSSASSESGSKSKNTVMMATSEALYDPAWYPDSGASCHVTPNLANLQNQEFYGGQDQVYIGDGKSLLIEHIGSSEMQSHSKPLILSSLLHVPAMKKNLLSVSKFAKDNKVYFEFHSDVCYVKCQDSKRILLRGHLKDGLYAFHEFSHSPQSSLCTNVSKTCNDSLVQNCNKNSYHCNVVLSTTVDTWHKRLGHPSDFILSQVLKSCNVSYKNNKTTFCNSCCLGKHHKLPFPNSSRSYTKPFQLIHSDVWGPSPYVSINGWKYYIVFIDSYTRYTWLYLLKNKSDAHTAFLNFKSLVENHFGSKILAFQSDGGGEFIPISKTLASCGIVHQISCPHTPEQNGLAERKHRHLTEFALTLMAQSSLPLTFWDHAISTATYLINRLPTPLLTNKSPYELLYSKLPDYLFLKTLGCVCFPFTRPYNKHKFDFKSVPCVFLGYDNKYKG